MTAHVGQDGCHCSLLRVQMVVETRRELCSSGLRARSDSSKCGKDGNRVRAEIALSDRYSNDRNCRESAAAFR